MAEQAGEPAHAGWWKRGFGLLFDLVYPPCCALCGEPLAGGRSLCGGCGDGLPRLVEPFCVSCGEPFEGRIDGDFECPNCEGLAFSFEFARPAMTWDDGTRELVHLLKYRRGIHVAEELGRLAAEAFADPRLGDALAGGWPLVPVPLHRTRLWRRHFNQAAEVARVVARQTGLPLRELLVRTRRTDTQTRLGRRERLENLKGAFGLSGLGRKWLVEAREGVVLVDDVLTTGSTVEACARVLRAEGVRRVQVVTVMRG